MNQHELQDYMNELSKELTKKLEDYRDSVEAAYNNTTFIGESGNNKVEVGFRNQKFSYFKWKDVSPEALSDLLCVAATDALHKCNNARREMLRKVDEKVSELAIEATSRAMLQITGKISSPEEIESMGSFIKNLGKKTPPSGTN